MTVQLDRRSDLISTLKTILSGLSITLSNGAIPAGNFVHNRDQLPAALTPGIILLDGDEVKDPKTIQLSSGRQQSRLGDQIVSMTPEIYVVLEATRTPENALVGEDLNTARLAILKALFDSTDLQMICGSNGGISYDGCVTDLAKNRQMRGQMGISMTFTYPLRFAEVIGR